MSAAAQQLDDAGGDLQQQRPDLGVLGTGQRVEAKRRVRRGACRLDEHAVGEQGVQVQVELQRGAEALHVMPSSA